MKNKLLDLDGADVPRVREELENVLNIDASIAIPISAKNGKNINRLIRQIIKYLPSPYQPKINFDLPDKSTAGVRRQKERYLMRSLNTIPYRAYIFDSWFELNKGCCLMIRVFNGTISVGSFIEISAFPQEIYQVAELGVFTPNKEFKTELKEGEVGFISCNLKTAKQGIEALGGSVLSLQKGLNVLESPKVAKPVVFASIFPDSPDESELLANCVEKILLEDPAIKCEKDNCLALGNGFRCGFLGELHLEIFQQRIFDEFGLNTIVTPANVVYEVLVIIIKILYIYINLNK